MQQLTACVTDTEGPLCDMQTVTDMVQHNSALLKELGEGRRAVKELKGFLQKEREQAKAVQLEYEQFRHQVPPSLSQPSCPQLTTAANLC